MSLEVEQKVDNLESVLQRFIVNTEKSFSSLSEERRKDRKDSKASFEEYKNENKVALEKYKEENKTSFEKYKEENRIALEKYKEENKIALEKYREENKIELKEFKQDMNKKWGELANKMGSLIEDIFIPGIYPTLEKYFNARLNFIGTYIKKSIKKSGLKGEFDIVATDEERVYLADIKSSPDREKIDDFKQKVIPRFRKLFPEYDSKILIPIMGSLRFDEDIISYASEMGIYVMGYREWEYLDILNFDEVKSK